MRDLEQLLKDREPRPIFIIGSYRSGTSVMTWALGQHPNIFPVEETYFLYKLSVDLDYLYEIGASRGARCFIGSARLTPRYFRTYFGRACDILIKSSQERIIKHALLPKYRTEHTPNIQLRRSSKDPKDRFVDGTPENSYFVLPLLRMFPKAKFIHILRNPKLVATSLMHFSTIGGTDYSEEEAYRIWMRMARAAALAELAFGPEYVLRVLWEDIVCNPETVIRRCLEFVGEEYHPDCLLPFREKVNSSRYSDPGDCSLPTNLRSPKPWIREAFSLYEALLNGEVPGVQGRMSALRELYRSLREYENSLRPDTNERLSRDNARLRNEQGRLTQQLAQREQTVQHLQGQLTQLQAEQERLMQQLAERERAVQQLQQRLNWKRYRIADRLLGYYWYLWHPKQAWQRAKARAWELGRRWLPYGAKRLIKRFILNQDQVPAILANSSAQTFITPSSEASTFKTPQPSCYKVMSIGNDSLTFVQALEATARAKFERDEDVQRWVAYWGSTIQRNEDLMRGFQSRVKLDFTNKTVLDIGCGTGGLAKVICEAGGRYIGVDYHDIIDFAKILASSLGLKNAEFVRASATNLPFLDETFDYIIGFDVIEHLIGGYSWQLKFCQEMRRVLKPNGLILMTTPNKLHPFEGHTLLYFPHYLPVRLADAYIRWRRPSFFKEYTSYKEIHLLSPWRLRKLLRESGLTLLHDFPWCMDWEDYPPRRRLFLRFLSFLGGLDWGWTNGFWFIACRQEDQAHLQGLKTKEWLRRPNPSGESHQT